MVGFVLNTIPSSPHGRVQGKRPLSPEPCLFAPQGRGRANNAIATLGADCQIPVRCDMPAGSAAAVHFLADVYGYFE
jgi:hypothetical protein